MEASVEHLEWKDKPAHELMRLAWPIAIAMLSYSAMTVVDTAFVGHLGAAALAGVGIAGVVSYTMLSFGLGLLRAAKVLVSQAVGSGKNELVPVLLGASLVVALGFGVFFTVVGQWAAHWIPSISASEDAGIAASVYLSIRMLGSSFALCFAAIREGRYGVGDSKTSMVAAVIGNILNVLFDALFIFALEWGVAGAAWASVLAGFGQLAVLSWMTDWAGWRYLKEGSKRVASIIRIGVPTGLQFVVEMSSFLAMSIVLSKIAETEMAAHQVAIQVLHFGFLPSVAVAEAVSVLAGQAVGADRFLLVRRVARDGVLLVSCYGAVFACLLWFFSQEIASVFTKDAAIIEVVVSLLFLAVIFQIVDGWQIVARGVLRGTGDVRVPAILGIGISWCITPPFTWYVGMKLGYGAWGGWLGITIEVFVAATILWHRFLTNRWHFAARATRAELDAA